MPCATCRPTASRPSRSSPSGPGSPPATATPSGNVGPWSSSSHRPPATSRPSSGWSASPSGRATPRRPRGSGRKSELDEIKSRYVFRLFEPNPVADASDLARGAEALGRWFEARGWWSLAARGDPGNPEATAALDRIAAAERRAEAGPTLGGLLADLGPAGSDRRGSPPSRTAAVGPTPRFVDEAEAAGLRFSYQPGPTLQRQIPETMGSGIGLLDFDGDGWLDVYLVQGGPFPPVPGSSRGDGDRLFRNRGDGTFEDVTEAAGIAGLAQGYGHGVTVGDIDNDGDPDLFLTRWGSYALYRNRGDGTFEDATEAVGLGGVATGPPRRPSPTWTTTATSTSTSATTWSGTPPTRRSAPRTTSIASATPAGSRPCRTGSTATMAAGSSR